MRVLLASLLWLIAGLGALAQDAAQDLARVPTPGWVDEIPLPPDDRDVRDQAQDGVHYLLSDHQISWQGEIRQSWSRTALEVIDRAGLELAATISFDYDPAFEEVALTRLVVWRDGREIDLAADVPATVMRREEGLDEGILDGRMTAYLQVPDVRLGDVVDYAVLRQVRPLLQAGEHAVFSELEWAVPVVLSRTVVIWPAGWAFHLAPLPARVAHLEGPMADGATRHEWQRLGHVPPRWEDNVPLADDPTAVLRLSDEADWGAISAALTPYYAADYPLGPWEARVAALAATSPDPETRAIAALRMVQDEVRYVSLSVGAGGIFARLPAEVVGSGFGDCKDKALLLAVMLKRLGVEGVVALTDLDGGHALLRDVPMLGAFDHAIVRIRLNGESHWVDPTASHQGGDFATSAPPDYGFALPLAGPGQTALEPLPVTAPRLWSSTVTERFRFSAAGVAIEVASEYRGGAADDMRQRWATSSRRQMSEDYLGYYTGRYPGLVLAQDIVMQDDRAANLLTMTEGYFLSAQAMADFALDAAFPFAAEDFAANLPDRLTAPRLLPLDSGAPAVFHHRIEIEGAPVNFAAPRNLWIENPGFAYALRAEVPGPGRMVLDWRYRRKGAVIAADQVAALMADRQRVYETTWFDWNLRP